MKEHGNKKPTNKIELYYMELEGQKKLCAKTNTLQNWEKNPRNIKKKDFIRLTRQLLKLGQYKPLLITPEGIVVGGNMRLKAYTELGIEDVWVSVIEPKNEDELLEYALSDNDRAGYYDSDLLANLSSNYPNFEWSTYAVDLDPPKTLDLVLGTSNVVEDEVPEVAEGDPISKMGEIYQLGKHRLMCGDSTSLTDVEKLMGGDMADMVFTDPPYNVDYEGYTDDALKIQNDKMSDQEFLGFLQACFANYHVATKSGASMYVCHPSSKQIIFEQSLNNAGFSVRNQIIWAKNTFAWGMGRYKYQHEPIFYCYKKGNSDAWYGDKSQSTLWQIDKPSANREHPTMKPIELCARAILNSSKSGDIVLDLFGGSGATLMACEQYSRACYLMELDPKYCDVIRKRYARSIGKEDLWQELGA